MYIAVTLILLLLGTWPMVNAQKVANSVCGDATGESNSRYTVGNIVWMIVASMLWVLTVVGVFAAP